MKKSIKAAAASIAVCTLLLMAAITQTTFAAESTVRDESKSQVVNSTPHFYLKPAIGRKLTKSELQKLAQKLDREVTNLNVQSELQSPLKVQPQVNPKDDPQPPAPGPKATSPLNFESYGQDPIDFKMPAAAEQFKNPGSEPSWTIGRPTPGGKGAGVIPAGLEAFYKQKINWGSCEPFGYSEDGHEGIQCAYVIAPLDYAQPNGPTIALGVLKVPAKDQAHRIGTLFTDPGGPGAPGMELAYNGIGREGDALNRFDLVGFDPRGVGDSLPQIRCESSAAFTAQRAGSDGLSGADLDKILKFNTDQCYTNTAKGFTGLSGDKFIPTVKTPNVAQDLDMMRSAFGDAKLSYLGFSYGTDIGYHYAKLFKNNIRALVLDGQVNPLENNHELLESPDYAKYWPVKKPESPDVAQMRGFNGTFRQFISACLSNDPEAVSLRDKQYPCALADSDDPVAPGKTPTEKQIDAAVAKYQSIARAAWKTGYYYSSTKPERPVSFQDVTQGTIQSMYAKFYWKYLNISLLFMSRLRDARVQLLLADSYYEYNSDDKSYNFLQFAFPTISCVDSSEDSSNREVQKQNALKQYEVAPFLDPGKDKDGTQRGAQPQYGWCQYYRTRNQATKGEPVEGAPNILVISSSYDPATPFENGVIAAKLLRGTLLAVANASHCAYGKYDCSTNVTDKYLVDPADFTQKVKNGYFTKSKDPLDTGKLNVETKDIYSKVIKANECQVISFMQSEKKKDKPAPATPKPVEPKNPQPAPAPAPAPEPGSPSKPAPTADDKKKVVIKADVNKKDLASTGANCAIVLMMFALSLVAAGVVLSIKRVQQ